MQVSVEVTSSVERKMTIGIPADKIENEIDERLKQTARTVRINGFRPGKVPAKVVKNRYGQAIRQEVVGEQMRNAYVEALQQENIAAIGYPKFEPKSMEPGKDLEFIAIVEVQPELEEINVEGIQVEKPDTEIKEKDIKNMIDVLRRQHGTPKSVKRKCKKKDVLTIDFKGSIDGEEFDGGAAQDHKLTLGSGSMIPGFEEGLIGAKAGETVELDVTFPEDYGKEDLAGKEAKFEVAVKEVEDIVLPEMDQDFYSKYGVTVDSEEAFRDEVVKNMERELKQAITMTTKKQVIEQLTEKNEIAVPQAMVESEVTKMKQEAVQQYGGGQLDPSQLPSELFAPQAETRIKNGLVLNGVIKKFDLKADAAAVDAKIEEMASTYESPEEVKTFYGQPENRAQVEALILEDTAIEHVLTLVKVKKKKMSYEDVVKASQGQ